MSSTRAKTKSISVKNLVACIVLGIGAALTGLAIILVWFVAQNAFTVMLALIGLLLMIAAIFMVGLHDRSRHRDTRRDQN